MTITCGIDWVENHHDVALADEAGGLVAKRRISDDMAGYRQLLELLADAGDGAEEPIPVAIETARGLLVACLRTTGRKVYSINPMALARYRERRTVPRAKSDHPDAMALANILRTRRYPPLARTPRGCSGGTTSTTGSRRRCQVDRRRGPHCPGQHGKTGSPARFGHEDGSD